MNLVYALSIAGICFVVKKIILSGNGGADPPSREGDRLKYKVNVSDMGVNNGRGGYEANVLGQPVRPVRMM